MPHNVPRYRFMLIALVALLSACSSAPSRAGTYRPAAVTASTQVTSIAQKMLGTPYRYGGATPYGFDCSGLVYYAYSTAGYHVPRSSGEQYRQAFLVKETELKEGDVLFFNINGDISHVGLYLGKGTFIHAPSRGKVVSYATLQDPYWKQHLVKAGRFF